MAMNPRLLRPRASGAPLFLDQYFSATAAYSVRKLRTSYAGPAVKVRRSSDSAESDFTFDELSNGTLAAWVGVGDGFVTTWYDQSGNGNDITQSTAVNQPTIVLSGAVVTQSNKPAIQFDGTNDVFTRNVFSFTAYTNVCVNKLSAIGGAGGGRVVWHNGNNNGVGLNASSDSNTKLSYFERAVKDNNFGTASTNYSIIAGVRTASSLTTYLNGTTLTLTPGTAITPTTRFSIGCLDGTSANTYFAGTMQELIFWASDLSSNFEKLTDAVNSYYKVF